MKKIKLLLLLTVILITAASLSACACTLTVENPLTVSATDGGTWSIKLEPFENGQLVAKNVSVTLTASPEEGYVFDGWYKGATRVSTSGTYTFNMPSYELSLQARFSPKTFALSVTAGTGGTVNPSVGKYQKDALITLTAQPETGYSFDGWYNGNVRVSSNQTYFFNMPSSDLSLQARFIRNVYMLNIFAEDGGSVDFDRETYYYNDFVTLTANPSAGYAFDGWYDDVTSVKVSANAVYGFYMPANDLSLTARFIETSPGTRGLEYDPVDSDGNVVEEGSPNHVGYSVNVGTAYENGSTEIVIPSSYNGKPVTVVGDSAFNSCYDLSSVILGDNITTVGDSAFYDCFNLSTVVMGDSITTIGNYAFISCVNLSSINIPNSVTSIGDSAFYNCYSLSFINIPSGLTAIGNSVFSGCRGLTSIAIPNGVTTIGNYAFSGCSGFTSLIIPSSVTTVGNEAFSYCAMLASITIPNSVTTIGSSAFCRCVGLTSITIPSSVTTVGEDAFYDCYSLTIYLEADSTSGWGNKWNDNRPVIRGCVLELYDVNPDTGKGQVNVVSFTKTGNIENAAGNALSAPYRDGYTFIGWNTQPDGNGTMLTILEIATAADGVYYAVWEIADEE